MPRSRPPLRRGEPSSRERNARRNKIIAAAVTAVLLLVLGAAFGYPLLNPKPKLDRATYCPVDGPKSMTAVLIDATDSINAVQKIAIENEFRALRDQIPRYGALAFYSAGFQGDISRPEFMLCNPGSLDDMDEFQEGRRRVEQNWKEGYLKPLDAVLERMLKTAPAQRTPLLEAIQSVSVQSFGPMRSAKRVVDTKLIVFSDLLQHSDNLSLYSKPPSLEQYLKSESYKKIRADLRDVDVHVFLIRRQTKQNAQSQELIRFWEGIVAAQGGRIARFKPLEG